MKFTDLVAQISGIDGAARLSAGRTLQQILSLRNWLIGAHIVEFEQAGEDRAAYGQVLMRTLAQSLTQAGCQGLSWRNLHNYRQLALGYPGLDSSRLGHHLASPKILQTSAEFGPRTSLRQTSAESGSIATNRQTSGDLPGAAFPSLARRALEQPLLWRDANWIMRLFTTLTFSHLLELSRIRSESDIESALVDHLQHFLFELGRDFCFIARQFRITASNRHRYIDLLLFHRRLRCLVAVDLKLGAFEPEHAGQLRFYVNYLAEHVAYPEENPPVGILLCAERNAEVVRFATAGDSDLFVSRYQFELPTEEQLKRWLHEECARIEASKDEAQ